VVAIVMPLIPLPQALAERLVHAERINALLLLGLVVIAAVCCGTWLRRQARKSWLQGPAQAVAAGRSTAIDAAVRLVPLLLIAIAATDIRLGQGSGEVGRSSEQIVLLLDRSRSMLADDAEPSRFELAVRIAEQVIDQAQGSAIAIVSFASDARIESPLSRDDRQLRDRLLAMKPEQGERSGTLLAQGLNVAANCFAMRFAGHKQLIVLTDGETHGQESLAGVDIPRDVDVLLLGIGDSVKGSRIPLKPNEDDGRRGSPRYFAHQGKTVWTKSQPQNLNDLARRLNGRHRMVASLADASRVASALRGDVRDSLRWDRLATAAPIYSPLLIAALVLLVAESFLPALARSPRHATSRRDRLNAAVGAVLAALIVCCVGGASPPPDSATESALDRRQIGQIYNRGVEAYRGAAWHEAEARFRRAMASRDGEISARSCFNLANTQYQLVRAGGMSKREATARLEESIELFRRCIHEQRRPADARANLQIAYALLKQIERQELNNRRPDGNGDEAGSDDEDEGSSMPPPHGDRQPPGDGQSSTSGGKTRHASTSSDPRPETDRAGQDSKSPPPGSTGDSTPDKWTDAEAEEELRQFAGHARRRGRGKADGQAAPFVPSGLPW
jgi:hypothetical protein